MGGTIVSRIDPATGLAVPVLSGTELMASLKPYGDAGSVEIHDVARVASTQLGLNDWLILHQRVQELVRRDDIAGVVITHGTSTLEETAWFLDLTVDTDKPIVITGAQRTASEPDSDGPRNLYNALLICRCEQARGQGVMVALNDHINAAREATKSHTLDVETFQSGEWGFLGAIVRQKVTFHRRSCRRLHVPLQSKALPQVDIVPMYVGVSGAGLRAALQDGAVGIVVQAVASGHVNEALYEAVIEARQRNIPVVLSTRIPRGGTRAGYGFIGSSQLMLNHGAVLAGDLSPWKARILLMLAIQAGKADTAQLRQLFGT